MYILISPYLLDYINIYRLAMYYEDMGIIEGYEEINNLNTLTLNILQGFSSDFFSPNPITSSDFNLFNQ